MLSLVRLLDLLPFLSPQLTLPFSSLQRSPRRVRSLTWMSNMLPWRSCCEFYLSSSLFLRVPRSLRTDHLLSASLVLQACMELYFSTVPVIPGSGTHPANTFFESSSASDHSHQSYSQPESPSRNRLSGEFNASVVLGREEVSGLRFELGTTKEEEGSNSSSTTIWSQICPAGCGHA